MNTKLLRSIMVLHDATDKSLAEELGISAKSVNNKINERDGAEFKQSEIATIKKLFRLSDAEVTEIFFT